MASGPRRTVAVHRLSGDERVVVKMADKAFHIPIAHEAILDDGRNLWSEAQASCSRSVTRAHATCLAPRLLAHPAIRTMRRDVAQAHPAMGTARTCPRTASTSTLAPMGPYAVSVHGNWMPPRQEKMSFFRSASSSSKDDLDLDDELTAQYTAQHSSMIESEIWDMVIARAIETANGDILSYHSRSHPHCLVPNSPPLLRPAAHGALSPSPLSRPGHRHKGHVPPGHGPRDLLRAAVLSDGAFHTLRGWLHSAVTKPSAQPVDAPGRRRRGAAAEHRSPTHRVPDGGWAGGRVPVFVRHAEDRFTWEREVARTDVKAECDGAGVPVRAGQDEPKAGNEDGAMDVDGDGDVDVLLLEAGGPREPDDDDDAGVRIVQFAGGPISGFDDLE
ncbi:hypothetical protein DAEQUDRAFT_760245 [Daedalea quercina L-15889]|uniref:Uncharacterized protein n=1 Tax=Daedalea quercina L-15889 TaxID=1314783 RepID=A0A165L429_9APHY|nr:hypothetical protein DAEQUDRAFT_760245 [Daedalea quercina L-15889]